MFEESSSITSKTARPSSETVVEASGAPSTTASTCGSQQRYYRNVRVGARPDPNLVPELRLPTPAVRVRRGSLEVTRLEALHTLDTCRHVIVALELTRLRKSRTGMYHWIAFWERLYERSFSNLLASRVMTALDKVDALFRAVSFGLHQLTQMTELAVASASTEKEILGILERMEEEVNLRRRRRRRKARHILAKMRCNMELIPVKVSDELFDDIKRGVFALDVYGDYHPGDPEAERMEQMWFQRFIDQPAGLLAVSPYLYRQWREPAVSSDTSVPLTAYSSNTRQTDTVEWLNYGSMEDNRQVLGEDLYSSTS
ncbi:hypothetical protein BJX63DRAFT_429443 [Aspergillus granulosus]|uniref:Uncharacterized protein n=1 Tax=Aspergillus granulosus TaxID=176169 RepID=A0ABR4HRJ9_9EURO